MNADDLHHDLDGIYTFLEAEHAPFPPHPQPLSLEGEGGRLGGQSLSLDGEGKDDWLEELDENQRLAATHGYGPMRVMAPAGSGKTRTLVSRVAFLIGRGVPPERILALAFNRKAQQEMQARLATMGHTVNVRTFHSFGYEIVRRGLGWAYHENSGARLAKGFRAQLAQFISPEMLQDLEPYFALLHRATMELVPLRGLSIATREGSVPFQPIFEGLLAAQTAEKLLTFDGMLYFALRVLLEQADLRHELQNQFEFVLVDEFQDLNQAQMLLTRIIALPQNNLFVVGDDDQMIYGWRGADVRLILDFPQTFPGAKTVVLGTNYRSSGNIVRHSRLLIEHNPERVAKDIQPRAGAENGPLEVILASGIRQQGKAALVWMEAQKAAHGLGWEAFAILFRVNGYILPILPMLEGRGIPFTLAKETGEGAEGEEDIPEVQPGAVTLLSIHKAKGKEFPFVVVLNLIKGMEDGAEERRVAYVGTTRAQKGLLITADEEHFSPFLTEFALRPEFADFGEAYLARQVAGMRKKMGRTMRGLDGGRGAFLDWLPWLRGSAEGQAQRRADRAAEAAALACQLEALETELRFRKVLGRG